jgi:hypothetical protein
LQLHRAKVVEKALEFVSSSSTTTSATATLHSFASLVSALTATPVWARPLIEDLCFTATSDDSAAFTAAAHAVVMRIIEAGTAVSVVAAVAEHLHAAVASAAGAAAAAAATAGDAAWSVEALYADAVKALITALTAAASAGIDNGARTAFTALKAVYSAVCEHASSSTADSSAVLESVQQLLTAFCSTDSSSGSATDRLLGYRADVLELLRSADTSTAATTTAIGHRRDGSAAALAAATSSATTGAAAAALTTGPSLAALRTAELVTRHFDGDAVAALRGSDQSWDSRGVLLDALFPQVSTATLHLLRSLWTHAYCKHAVVVCYHQMLS